MSTDGDGTVTRLFLEAADLSEPEREEFLQRACGDDDALRERVRRLLDHDAPTDDLRRRVGASTAPIAPPEKIGPYTIDGLLGLGGMGQVYGAHQHQPIERSVAIKLVHPQLAGPEAPARFEFERRSLARMDHPNVARILDAGTTEAGSPYFVMERIEGLPLHDYCRANRPSLDERLRLFLEICRGVEHAHRNGVIHRDLKPSNVLVAMVDGQATPKIIDFGIARAIDDGGATRADQRPGTLGYMSPEQLGQGAARLDTRSDVYGLGVLLFELVTGSRPAAGVAAGDAAWIEPSRLPLDATCIDVPSRRRLRGDLDWIVWRAMQRDPERRYGSAAALADDVQRHRERRPIQAHPQRWSYRWGRFMRRHRLPLGLAAGLLLALCGFATAMTLQAAQVREQRDLATIERDRANASAARARRVLEHLVAMFQQVGPEQARGAPPSAKQMLERGAAGLNELDDDPAAQAWLRGTIGRVYRDLGAYDQAERMLRDALATQQAAATPDEIVLATMLHDLGALLVDTGKFDEAARRLGEALERRRRIALAGGTAGTQGGEREVAQTLNELGRLSWERGEYPQAEAYYRQALALHERIGGPGSYDVAVDLINVSNAVNQAGRLDEGRAMLERALAVFESTGVTEDLHFADGLNNLGIVERRAGNPAQAVDHLRRATAIRLRVLGQDHPDVALSRANLGSALWDLGDLQSAQEQFEHSLRIREQTLPPDHPHLSFSINALAVVYKNLGQLDRAEALYARGLAIASGRLGEDHPDVARILGNLGNLERERGRLDAAESYYRRAGAIYRERFGDDHPNPARIDHALGRLELDRGAPERALPLFRNVLRVREAQLGPDHPDVAAALASLGTCQRELGELQAAHRSLEQALRLVESRFGPDHAQTQEIMRELEATRRALSEDPPRRPAGAAIAVGR